MSICFTWFPIVVLGVPNIYHDSGDFTRIGDFTWEYVWRVSDCEEIVDLCEFSAHNLLEKKCGY